MNNKEKYWLIKLAESEAVQTAKENLRSSARGGYAADRQTRTDDLAAMLMGLEPGVSNVSQPYLGDAALPHSSYDQLRQESYVDDRGWRRFPRAIKVPEAPPASGEFGYPSSDSLFKAPVFTKKDWRSLSPLQRESMIAARDRSAAYMSSSMTHANERALDSDTPMALGRDWFVHPNADTPERRIERFDAAQKGEVAGKYQKAPQPNRLIKKDEPPVKTDATPKNAPKKKDNVLSDKALLAMGGGLAAVAGFGTYYWLKKRSEKANKESDKKKKKKMTKQARGANLRHKGWSVLRKIFKVDREEEKKENRGDVKNWKKRDVTMGTAGTPAGSGPTFVDNLKNFWYNAPISPGSLQTTIENAFND